MIPTLENIIPKLLPIFKQYGVKKATVFGSVAKGLSTSTSDIDLLVDSGLRGLRFSGLLASIADAVDIPVDVFDVTHIEPGSQIDREIRRTGVDIYEA